MREKQICWVVTDGAMGNVKPAMALAEALARLEGGGEGGTSGLRIERIDMELRAPWSWLAPRLSLGARFALGGQLKERLLEPPPALLIAAGRRAALGAIAIRSMAAERTFTIQLLNPRVDPGLFDLVVCPRHDGLSGDNVLTTLGSLHDVTDEKLAQWRHEWRALERSPGPRVALLIGGASRGSRFDPDQLDELISAAERVVQDQGTLLVTTSRRTPIDVSSSLRERFGARALFAEDFEANPYRGYLAWADHLFVTPDSVNMLSEALGCGAPVYTLEPRAARPRLARFHRMLNGMKLIHQPSAAPVLPSHAPLREADAVAEIIRERWPRVAQV